MTDAQTDALTTEQIELLRLDEIPLRRRHELPSFLIRPDGSTREETMHMEKTIIGEILLATLDTTKPGIEIGLCEGCDPITPHELHALYSLTGSHPAADEVVGAVRKKLSHTLGDLPEGAVSDEYKDYWMADFSADREAEIRADERQGDDEDEGRRWYWKGMSLFTDVTLSRGEVEWIVTRCWGDDDNDPIAAVVDLSGDLNDLNDPDFQSHIQAEAGGPENG